jgi:hypothetical protein
MGRTINGKSVLVGKPKGKKKRGWTEFSCVRISTNDGCLWAQWSGIKSGEIFD